MIALEPAQHGEVERMLGAMPAVTALYTVSGAHDIIALLGADSTESLDAALAALRACPGVKATTVSVILSRRFER